MAPTFPKPGIRGHPRITERCCLLSAVAAWLEFWRRLLSMKRTKLVAVVLLAFPVASGQVDNVVVPVPVTMCDLYKSPERYGGKLVQFRAVAMGRDLKHLWLDDFAPPQGCDAYMHVIAVLPSAVSSKTEVELVEDQAWRKFVTTLPSMTVEATFVGVFNPYFVWREHRRVRVNDVVPSAYRKKTAYDARLVLRNVANVDARQAPRM